MDNDTKYEEIIDTLISLAKLIGEIQDDKCMFSYEDIETDFGIKLHEDDPNEICERILEREEVSNVIINEYGFIIELIK